MDWSSPDRWREIGESLWRHRTRTLLTMLSVAWGTFVLVVLLGMGQGLQNTVKWQFRDDAINSVWFFRGETTRPYEGLPVGRRVRYDNDDYDVISAMSAVEHATGRFYPFGGGGLLAYQGRSASYDVRAVHPGHRHHENTIITSGRFIDELDLRQQRKVAVIGDEVAAFLFRGADPIGAWVNLANVPFRVVGVFHDVGGDSERRKVYVPVSTAQAIFGGGGRELSMMMFVVGDATAEEAAAFAEEARLTLSARQHIHPEDTQAIRVRNNVEEFERIQSVFRLLDLFVWGIGVGTIAAGIVGVSNIMLVSVRERISEIGLRKALGATPASIVSDVLQEAVILTATSGYVGVVAGVAVLEALRTWMPENDYLREPEITLWPALVAAVLLVVFGALAGFVPAWRAARIQPVEALRSA